MNIHLATDHAGFAHKEAVRTWLESEGFTVVDHGAREFDPLDDYPDFIEKAAAAVSAAPKESQAIIFGGSGQGEAMVANRFLHVRAAVLYVDSEEIVMLSRQHNDANVLSVGARFVSIEATKKHIWTWLHTKPLEDKKYARRNEKVTEITKRLHS